MMLLVPNGSISVTIIVLYAAYKLLYNHADDTTSDEAKWGPLNMTSLRKK